MSDFSKKAEDKFMEGYSCSESVVRAAYDEGLIDNSVSVELLTRIASPFSGGMSSGCACGAIVGSQMVLGLTFGRKDTNKPPLQIKTIARSFIDRFKQKRNAVCCRTLTKDYDFNDPERRQHCKSLVGECAEILEDCIKENQ